MKGDERRPILRADFQEFLAGFSLPDPQVNRIDCNMIGFPFARKAQANAEEVIANIGSIKGYFVERSVPGHVAADSIRRDQFDREERASIRFIEICTELAPF